jgi:dolichol-phosphate mannosyltransferase
MTGDGYNPSCSSGQMPPWDRSPGKIIVVLPAYNEEVSLGSLLQRIDQAMCEDRMSYEVILVDDGSADRTVAIADEHAQYMPLLVLRHQVNQGLGATIRDGLAMAVSRANDRDIIVAMDADNSHTPGLIRSMTRRVMEGNDVVIASRYRYGSYVRGVPLHRRLLSLGARVLFQIAFPITGVRDYTCGYRAYRSLVLREAFSRFGTQFVSQTGFQCMVDILLKLRAMDAIFSEVPLILRYDLKGGASKMKVMQTITGTLGLLIRRRLGIAPREKARDGYLEKQ